MGALAGSDSLKQQLEQLLLTAVSGLVGGILPEAPEPAAVAVERTRDPKHGDFATNIALRLAKPARRNPRELAQAIIAALPANSLVARTEVAGGGFINFFLTTDAYARELTKLHELADRYGRANLGNGQRVMLEFVSANPTGPLHVGHGRQAAYGATLANLLNAVGFSVSREYYINDAGRQMDILTVSAWLRYLEQGWRKHSISLQRLSRRLREADWRIAACESGCRAPPTRGGRACESPGGHTGEQGCVHRRGNRPLAVS